MTLSYDCQNLWDTANQFWGGDFKGMLRAWGWSEQDAQALYDGCRIVDFPTGILYVAVRLPGSPAIAPARVYVNSVFAGISPVTANLAVGQYTVTIEDNWFEYNGQVYTHPRGGVGAIVDANRRSDVYLDLEEIAPEIRVGTLVVRTLPISGVPVSVDSVVVGNSPVSSEQAVGAHTVSAEGFLEQQALVKLGEVTEVTLEAQDDIPSVGNWAIPALLAVGAVALAKRSK